MRAAIGARIPACRDDGKPVHIICPATVVSGALRGVREPGLSESHQRAAVSLGQIDFDQARSWRHLYAALPTERVGEPVDRNDLSAVERARFRPGAPHLHTVGAWSLLPAVGGSIQGHRHPGHG